MSPMKGPSRVRPCPTCKSSTRQTLTPTSGGAAWLCDSAGHAATTYTPDDMRELLGLIASALPVPPPRAPISTEGIRVFVEGVEGEAELDDRFVKQHVEIMGALPVTGQPLYQRVAGIPAPFNSVPYGKVLRIEWPKPSAT